MKKFIAKVLVVSIVASSACFTTAVYADTDKKTYIVRLSQPPVYEVSDTSSSDGLSVYSADDAETRQMRVQSEQKAFKSSVSKSTDSEIVYQYDQVFNGMAIEATEEEIAVIKAMPNVTGVYESQSYTLEIPEATSSDNEEVVYDLGDNINADPLREEMNKLEPNSGDGEGMVIAVIDSEFDVNHEAYSLTDNSKIKITKKNVSTLLDNLSIEGLKANQVYVNEKIPFAFNYINKNKDVTDYQSASIHGTHVAGIAAGNSDTLRGIAPNAQLVLMKCTDDNGTLYNSALLAAIDDAVEMKVDVINFSIGAIYANCSDDDPFMEALKNLSAGPTELFASAGNSGLGMDNSNVAYTSEVSYDTGGNPAGSPYNPVVGNAYGSLYYNDFNTINLYSDLDSVLDTSIFVNGGESDFVSAFKDGKYELADVGYGSEEDYEYVNVDGKIVLVTYGNGESSYELRKRVQEHNGKGMIIVLSTFGKSIYPTEDFPAAIITPTEYESFKNAKYIQTTGEVDRVFNEPAMADSSSYAVNEYLNGGVQLSARGTDVMSSMPDDKYSLMTGTSMASPMAAGAYALVKSYLQKKYPDLESDTSAFTTLCVNMMQNTADIIYDPDTEDEAPYPTRLQGAGYINMESLSKNDVVLTDKKSGKGMVYCGATEENTLSFTLKLQNLSDKDVTYNSISGVTVRNATEGDYLTFDSTDVTSSFDMADSVTVPANGEFEFPVSVTISDETRTELDNIFENGFFMDGFVIFKGEGVQQISIPFTSFIGDFYKAPIFDGSYATGDNLYSGTEIIYYSDEDYAFGTNVNPDTDRIVISTNSDNNYLLSEDYMPTIYALQLRGSQSTTMTVQSDDEIIYQDSLNGVVKYYTRMYDLFEVFSNEKEGEYTVSLEAVLNADVSGETKDKLDFDVYLDNTAPVLEDVVYDEGNNTLTVYASDNYGLKYVDVEDSDGNEVEESFTKSDSEDDVYTAVLDLSEMGEYYEIYVYDYAYNYATTAETDEDTTTGISLGNLSEYYSGSIFYKEIEITNNGSESVSLTPILAIYGSDGALLKLVKGDEIKNLTGTESYTFKVKLTSSSFPSLKIPDDATVKVYLWDSLDNMKPLKYIEEENDGSAKG